MQSWSRAKVAHVFAPARLPGGAVVQLLGACGAAAGSTQAPAEAHPELASAQSHCFVSIPIAA